MNCARCGASMAADSNFCSRCGTSLVPKPSQSESTSIAIAAPSRKKVDSLGLAMLSVAIITLVVLGLAATDVLQTNRATGTKVVYVPRGESKPMVALPVDTIVMPEHVRAYLQHIQRIEERKLALLERQKQHLRLTLIAQGDLAKPIVKSAQNSNSEEGQPPANPAPAEVSKGLATAWQSLLRDFEAIAPPNDCRDVSESYFEGLNTLVPFSQEVAEGFVAAVRSPKAVSLDDEPIRRTERPFGRSRAAIDGHFERAEISLADLCAKYETPKWFDIVSDLIPDDPEQP